MSLLSSSKQIISILWRIIMRTHYQFYQHTWTALLLVFITSTSTSAAAPSKESSQLETILVTAQKSKEDKQKIPANITVIDGFTMQDLGVDRIDELTELAPNINTDKIDSHFTQVVFRGIGGMTNMNKVWNINVDGVTVPYVGIDMFLDVERVELMRGSQGSLYGRNTHAGVVNVITRKPTPEFSLDTTVELENYNTQKVNAAFGGPTTDDQSYRIALGYTRGDGFIENDFLNSDDGNHHEQFSGRATYQYEPTTDNRLLFTITGDSYDGGFDAYAPISGGATTTTNNNEEGTNSGHLLSPTLTWEKQLSTLSLTSITNYSNSNYQLLYDQDFSQYDLMLLDYTEDFNTFTQEFRLAGNSSANIQWLAGIFLMTEQIDILTDFSFGNDAAVIGMPSGLHMLADSSIDSHGAALFGQMSMLPVQNLEISAQLRLNYEKRKLTWQGRTEMGSYPAGTNQNYTRDDDWVGIMPSASLSYIFSEEQRMYGSVARGYKVGDYAANQVTLDAVLDPVDPEYTMTYEIGYKGLLVERRLELNAAVFYIDWTDMQVSVMKDNVALMQNAAEAHSYGVELETRWRLTKGFDLFAGFGWLEGEFDSFANHPSGQDLAGNKLPNSNEYSLSVGTIYRHDNGFFASLTAALLGPKYMDEQNQIKQENYTLVNAKVGYESADWAAYLYGRNLLDESYLVHSFSDGGRAGEPAIIGAQLNYFF
jgi:iron complex outermembrane recepter protein